MRPRDLPECWGIKIDEINMPGCSIDLDSIKNEVKRNGFQRRAYFAQPVGPKKQQRCTLILVVCNVILCKKKFSINYIQDFENSDHLLTIVQPVLGSQFYEI